MQTQNYNHNLAKFPTSYYPTAPIAEVPYQYPAYMTPSFPSLPTHSQAQPRYPPGLVPAFDNNRLVTSGPAYISPKPHSSFQQQALNSTSQLHTQPHIIGATNFTGIEGQVLQHSSVQQGLQGYSRIEYIPYESYYIDYEQRQFVQNVVVPVQRSVTDYYAVQHVVDYVPREIEETVIDMVPEEIITEKVVYLPVQRQVVHLPQDHGQVIHTGQTVSKQVTQHTQQIHQTSQVTGKDYIVSQPLQHGVQTQNIIRDVRQVSPVRPGSEIRPGSQATVPQVRPLPVPQPAFHQRVQNTVSDIRTLPPQPGLQTVTQVRPPQGQVHPGQITPQPPTFVSGSPPQIPQDAKQFTQSVEIQRQSQQQMQQQMKLPQNSKVQYQYSTRTVRTLSPNEVPARSSSPVPQQIQTRALQSQPQFQSRPTTLGHPQGAPLLKANQKVDLADSEHINITKSVFHATYNPQTQQLPLSQGFATGTNPGVYTSVNGSHNSNTYSFGQPTQSLNTNVNRSSIPGQANRGSGGSVFDYDNVRDY